MEVEVSALDKIRFLRAAGWVKNVWDEWYPPSKFAAYPLDKAYAMAKQREEESNGRTRSDA